MADTESRFKVQASDLNRILHGLDLAWEEHDQRAADADDAGMSKEALRAARERDRVGSLRVALATGKAVVR